jgi:hypothetical protein
MDKKTDGRSPTSAYIPRFRNVFKQETDFLRGYAAGFSASRPVDRNTDGFGEELKEVTTSLGAEYLFNNAFAIRGGYFNESEMKGNRKYFTMGVGFKLDQKYGFDFAYLIPTGTSSPLANTLRVTLLAAINNDNGKR